MSFEIPEVKKEKDEEKLETGKKTFDFLDKTGFLEMRKSDDKFEEWIQKVSYNEFLYYLKRLNGILRSTPIKERSIDGNGVEISFSISPQESGISYITPPEDKKNELMHKTFEAMKGLDNNDRALLCYYIIQALHPFNDGNGRTGRLFYELISEDGKTITREELSNLLDHDKKGNEGQGDGRKEFSKEVLEPSKAYYLINRELVKQLFGEEFSNKYEKIHYTGEIGAGNLPEELDISEDERKRAKKIIGERDVPNFSFATITLLKLLIENGKLNDCRYEIKRKLIKGQGVVDEDLDKMALGIREEEFMSVVTEEDVKRMISISEEIKVKFIEMMIEIFKNSENHKTKISDESVPIKNLFSIRK